jgi:ligand-binding SRPBCC domain-containing protein
MPKIQLKTLIKSSIEICFDLSRSIDLHKVSMAHSNEEAVAGTTTGLITLGESVTWQATHFGIRQKLSSRITAFDRPYHFRDEQIKGAFKSFVHDHYFELRGEGVLMKDIFEFESPLGVLGYIANKIVLINYLTKLITERNNTIKKFAESERWKEVPGLSQRPNL